MSGRRTKFSRSPRKLATVLLNSYKNKVYSVYILYCIIWLGYGYDPLPLSGCCCNWKEQWKKNFEQK